MPRIFQRQQVILLKGTTDQASAVEELTATVETVAALAKKECRSDTDCI